MIQTMDLARQLYKSCALDALLILSPSNTLYLSGYSNPDAAILITADNNYYVTDRRYTAEADRMFDGAFEVIDGDVAAIDRLLAVATRFYPDKASLGWDGDISYQDYLAYKSIFDGYNSKDISDAVSAQRNVKYEFELECIAKAQGITDRAFEYILGKISEGISEIELAADLEYFILKNGAETAFESIVAFGENGSSPHAHRSQRRLRRGDLITMDFGAKYAGYCSDMTRTVAFGEIDGRKRGVYDAVLAANVTALAEVKAGEHSARIDASARAILNERGLGEYFTHSTGHGVGVDIHEPIALSQRSRSLLQKGNVVTIEPGVYINGFCGVRIEDMVAVEADGCRNFTASDKRLIILK